MASIITKTLAYIYHVNLAYIYHTYYIISSKAANKQDIQGQEHRHGSIKELLESIKKQEHKHVHLNSHIMFKKPKQDHITSCMCK